MHKVIFCRGGAPVRRKLHIVCGCVPRRLLIPLFLTSVKSHAAARRRKLRIACGCVPRRLLTPLLLLSVKSHAAALLLACKRARDAPPCYQLFTGKRAHDAPPCYQLFTVSGGQVVGKIAIP